MLLISKEWITNSLIINETLKILSQWKSTFLTWKLLVVRFVHTRSIEINEYFHIKLLKILNYSPKNER